jgi:hypothetical protein
MRRRCFGQSRHSVFSQIRFLERFSPRKCTCIRNLVNTGTAKSLKFDEVIFWFIYWCNMKQSLLKQVIQICSGVNSTATVCTNVMKQFSFIKQA